MDRGSSNFAPDTWARDVETLETGFVRAEGIGRHDVPNESIRKMARELIAVRGKDGIAFADYKATIHERAGLWDEARLWRKIEGTLLAMIDED
jgi:hypothetical protein